MGKFPSLTVSTVAYTLGLNCKTKIQRSVNHHHSVCDTLNSKPLRQAKNKQIYTCVLDVRDSLFISIIFH